MLGSNRRRQVRFSKARSLNDDDDEVFAHETQSGFGEKVDGELDSGELESIYFWREDMIECIA